MATFRIPSIAGLARQLDFTPADTRLAQLAATENLLHSLNPDKAYPFDFIIYRITGYQPKLPVESDLLTGSALQHDLGLLIEQVSQTLDLHTRLLAEPVLSIDDVTEKFNVTSKTIQRWRRRGLPARRFIFPDGKKRVGFLLGSVEKFINAHQDQLATNISQVDDAERSKILRRAHRLATSSGCCAAEIARRIGKKLHRSPLTILHTLRKHDAEHPESAVLCHAAPDVSDEQRARITRGYKRGLSLRSLSRRIHRPRSVIHRVIVDERVARLNKRKIKFIDDPLYHETDAQAVIAAIVAQDELPLEMKPEEARVPRDLPPYFQELYRVPLLSAARERALFLKFNFHKWQFISARRKLEPQFARARDLQTLENFLHAATSAKNQLIAANLRLVVSVARKHLRPGLSLMELISEGNLTLMRAIEGFDIHKGNRFSTYATLALMKGFARAVPLMLADRTANASAEALAAMPDVRQEQAAVQRLDRDHLHQLLSILNDRERHILLARYGLEHSHTQARPLSSFSKRQIRQIEKTALAKLRAVSGLI